MVFGYTGLWESRVREGEGLEKLSGSIFGVFGARMPTKKLGPWVKMGKGDDPTEVRYPDPLDGRVWELDGSPRWVVQVDACCHGEKRHYTWVLVDRPEGRSTRVGGNAKTREGARQAAEEALRGAGWELG